MFEYTSSEFLIEIKSSLMFLILKLEFVLWFLVGFIHLTTTVLHSFLKSVLLTIDVQR